MTPEEFVIWLWNSIVSHPEVSLFNSFLTTLGFIAILLIKKYKKPIVVIEEKMEYDPVYHPLSAIINGSKVTDWVRDAGCYIHRNRTGFGFTFIPETSCKDEQIVLVQGMIDVTKLLTSEQYTQLYNDCKALQKQVDLYCDNQAREVLAKVFVTDPDSPPLPNFTRNGQVLSANGTWITPTTSPLAEVRGSASPVGFTPAELRAPQQQQEDKKVSAKDVKDAKDYVNHKSYHCALR